jgi:hypothetical protein
MKRFKSPRQVQRFLSTHDQIANVLFLRLDPGNRRGDGCVIMPIDGDHRKHDAMAAAPANECSAADALVSGRAHD